MLQTQDTDAENRDSTNTDDRGRDGDLQAASSTEVRTYWRRWLVLAVFSFNLCLNTWI